MNPQLIYDIAEKVHSRVTAGRDTIRLNIGEPEGTPPASVGAAVADAITAGKTKYGSSYGEMELRQRLADHHGVAVENILIGPGSKFLLYSLLHHFLSSSDDEVVLPLPSWSAFPLMVKDLGKGMVRSIPTTLEGRWQIPEDIESSLTRHTKLIILVNPNNPTSTIQGDATVERLREIARKKNIILIFDEAYHALQHVPVPEQAIDVENEIRVRTFSKPYSMTGFRIGYLVARKEVVDELAKFFQITITCVPPFIQHAVVQTMDTEHAYTKQLRETYHKRLTLAEGILRSAGIVYARPDAAFYIFAKLPLTDAEPFVWALLEDKGVAVVPGSAFGSYPEFVRISLTETEERLAQGLTSFVEALKAYA